MNKRGQAAMEFLMTYGWALLVVLIAIAALAFFGVLNPQRFLPETCTLAPGFGCTDFKVTALAATVVLQNGLGSNINTGVTLTVNATENHACSSTSAGTGATWLDGKSSTFCMPLNALGSGCAPAGILTGVCTGLAPGAKFKADLVLGYTPTGGTGHTKVGQLVAKLEA